MRALEERVYRRALTLSDMTVILAAVYRSRHQLPEV